VRPALKIGVQNRGDRVLYCALVTLWENFEVAADLFPAGAVRLDPGADVTWALDGAEIEFGLLDEQIAAGITETTDIVKAIACTAAFNPRLLEQSGLAQARTRSADEDETPAPGATNVLEHLLGSIQTRAVFAKTSPKAYGDWTVTQTSVTTVRPRDGRAVSQTATIDLGSGVTIHAHPLLKATARLTTTTQSSRDLGHMQLPAMLRDLPSSAGPLLFAPSRGTDPGLSVLELRDVQDPSVVSEEHPLEISADARLQADEYALPIAFDGEWYLPLGSVQRQDNGVTIQIVRLPDPVAQGTKSVTGSIRIFFHKIVAGALGRPFEYPILAAVDWDGNDRVQYEKNTGAIAERVAAASDIVLFIHGIIGDTRGMVVREAGADRLLLTFDYENLNTPIEELAAKLKARLEAIGLGMGHGKRLTIVAHSMGGLVSRYFVEYLSGASVVTHLVLCGTPNAGSPWPTIEQWATTALTFGLNMLVPLTWPVFALSGLVAATSTLKVDLKQMMKGSPVLDALAKAPNPAVPYTVLAGNTSLVAAAREAKRDGSYAAQLLGKLSPSNVLHKTTALAFLGDPNDIAVSTASIVSVDGSRIPAPRCSEVACDHLTYFSSDAGVAALRDALQPAPLVGGD
jgi:pimeloyl-ACP methyl ester carboxylesterase